MVGTIYAKPMRCFGFISVWLGDIGQRTNVYLFKLVLFQLSIPFFKLSNFFFKLAYASQLRGLMALGIECRFLSKDDMFLKGNDSIVNRLALRHIRNVLSDVEGGF